MSNADVHQRFRDVVPRRNIEDFDIIEMKRKVLTAFSIIGYIPHDLDASFRRVWENCELTTLREFISAVFEVDSHGC